MWQKTEPFALPTELWAHISVTVDCQVGHRTKHMTIWSFNLRDANRMGAMWATGPKERAYNWPACAPSWANRPNRPFFNQKSCKKRIFEIFNFEGIVRKTEQKIGRKNRTGDGSPYGCEPYALPDWATGPNQQFQKRNRRISNMKL